MASRFEEMVDAPQKARMAEVDQGITPSQNGAPLDSNFAPDSPEAALEKLQARRKQEGRPAAAALFDQQQQDAIDGAAATMRRLNGDEAPVDQTEADPADEEFDDDPELEALDADDVDDEDALDVDDADPGDDTDEDEDATPRDAPRGWREDGRAAELFATLDPDMQDEIVRRADAADAEYDRRFGELRQVEEQTVAQARSTQSTFEAVTQYLQTMLQEDIPQEPSPELLNPDSQHYDPEQHARATHHYRAAVTRYNQRVEALKKLHAENQKKAAEKRAADMAESERVLFRQFPEWLKNDGRDGQEAIAKIKQSIVDRGVDPIVAENLFDATLLMIAKDAMHWREYQATRKRVKGKKVPRRVKKVQAAGRGRRTGAARADAANLEALKKRARETGSVEDAAAYRKARRASQQRG